MKKWLSPIPYWDKPGGFSLRMDGKRGHIEGTNLVSSKKEKKIIPLS